jgi:hypothetical protein
VRGGGGGGEGGEVVPVRVESDGGVEGGTGRSWGSCGVVAGSARGEGDAGSERR